MTTALKPNTEPIPGYQVMERLGTGGYGEVWKVEAPGGLHKAIKFIYGYLSDEKATRELKALNRIREIRHPFLLSLERIEIVEGQLLIVTELADASLKDRFQACLDAGLVAIPREELLAHLRDAADALDFLSENALQHLDVKPENLLLVGGRMKVADFGLLKEITDRTCSMMGGMTPVYAAPELFDGRPSSTSDQYSLAIVFQEMLTGALPFPGNTAAQLASQHLHSRPRLESLPPNDIAIIAKALSKNPLDRFASSRALIDALTGTEHRTSTPAGDSAALQIDDPTRDTKSLMRQDTTPLVDGAFDPPAAAPRRAVRRTPPPVARPAVNRLSQTLTKTAPPPLRTVLRELPPIEVKPEEVGLRPTLFVGIGGTAGYVLRRLRRRLNDRFGGLANVPILKMLLIDTDVGAFAPQSDPQCSLDPAELLAMPLRKPQEYREDSLEILQWLSRRWLYNIPRSLKTEGLRPLGRLALVDHANALFERMREALTSITAEDSIKSAQSGTGLRLRDASPRVFVVASISGGTGSGMVLDVAYALRMLMADLGISDDGLCGMLAHSTRRNASAKDLAVANAYACLNELSHYTQESYPGEPACGLRAFDQDATFPRTYFVHLGDRLGEEEFASATDSLAEYLYLDAATAGGAFFDKCRAQAPNGAPGGDVQLRTFGVCQLGCSQNDLPAAASEWLLHQVVDRWANGAASANQAHSPLQPPRDAADSIATALKLDWRLFVDRFQAELEKSCPKSLHKQLARALVREPLSAADEPLEKRWAYLVTRAKQSLGLAASADPSHAAIASVTKIADEVLKHTAEQLSAQIVERIITLADDRAGGLKGALSENEQLVERFRANEQELNAHCRRLQERLSRFATEPELPSSGRRAGRRVDDSPEALTGALETLLALYIEHKSVESAMRLAGALGHRLVTAGEWLMRMRRETVALAGSFDTRAWSHAESHTADDAKRAVEHAVRRELSERLTNVAAQLERQIVEQVIAPRGGLCSLLSASGEELRLLPASLRSLARVAVVQEIKQIDIAKIVLASDADSSHQTLKRCLDTAWPSALKCGGAQRLLLVMPQCPSAARLPEIVAEKRQEQPSVLFDTDCDVVACFEGEQIGLESLAAVLTHDNPQYVEVAHRLHTRVDVDWTSI